ncbi:MAG: hypothetical protein ACRC6X_02655 [Culicoidibacterales bacterium]
MKFVFCGHGHFGLGYKSNIEAIAGQSDDLLAIDFLETMTESDLENQILTVIADNSGQKLLFICDIIGGTPFKIAATQAMDNAAIEVICGCNTSGILEVLLTKNTTKSQIMIENMINASKANIQKFEKEIRITSTKEVLDGI